MPHELKNLVLEEVSAVDRPANLGARVVLLKNDEKRGTMNHSERVGLMKRLSQYLGVSDEEIIKEEDHMADEAVAKQLKELSDKIAKLEQEKVAAEAVSRSLGEIAAAKTAADVDAIAAKSKDQEQVAKAAEARKAELGKVAKTAALAEFRKTLSEPVAKAFDEMCDDDKEDFMTRKPKKSEDPLAKALETVTKSNDELKAQVAKLLENQDLAALKAELKDLSGVVNVDEFAPAFMKLRSADKAAADTILVDLRKTAKMAAAGGLFKIVGKDGVGAGNADEKIDKAVKKYREEHPEVTEAVAMTKVLEADPKLYEASISESKGA